MAKMSDMNFIVPNCVKDEIPKAWNYNHPRIRLVDLFALIGRMSELHYPVDQARDDARRGKWAVFADISVNAFEIVKRWTRDSNFHPR